MGTYKWPQDKWLNMKTFSTKCNEEKTAFLAPQESSYSAKKSHFLLTKMPWSRNTTAKLQIWTSDVQAFRVEN
jgi:hypothetical protein